MSREGWAWGTTDGGEWLTILGSTYQRPTLTATAEEAVRPDVPRPLTLARVREVYHPGVTVTATAYRILKVHAPAEQATDGPR